MTIEQLFFELIRVSIGVSGCLSKTPTTEEWKALYEMAKKQSLVGVCFAGLCNLGADPDEGFTKIGMSEDLFFDWMGMAAKIQQRNEVVNRQCVELQAKLAADGFLSYIMKGQAVGTLYQVHDCQNCGDSSRAGTDPAREKTVENHNSLQMLRQSGDIDVYTDGGLDKVLAYARTFGEIAKVNELEMSVPVFSETEVEFHYRPFIMRNPFKNAKLQKFFKSCEEKNFSNTLNLSNSSNNSEHLTIVAPTIAFNLVHQLVHTYHHFITEGVGLRQLMDYYFVLRTSYDNDDENENVLRIVRELGLNRFASALMWVIKTVFVGHDNDDDDDNFFLWAPCEKDGRLLLDEILMSGNFGHSDDRAKDIHTSRWKAFWFVNGKTFRFWRFDHWAWFWSPVWRIYHFIWRKVRGFK